MRKRNFTRFLSRAQLFVGLLLFLYAVLLGILEGATGNKFPSSFNPIFPMLGLLIAMILLLILSYFIERKRPQQDTQSGPNSNQEEYLRLRLVERVYDTELQSFFDASLYRQHPLRIPLALHHGKNQHREENAQSHPLPRTILFDISQAYERTQDGLLLLGSAGSGKTTQLLLLTKHLLEKARKSQQNNPIPVIFHLSDWRESTLELEDWLVEQLEEMYKISPIIARSWLEFGTIQPFLDGLDEIQPDNQQKCIEQINCYRQHHGLVPLVVTCRTDHYERQHIALDLESIIEVLPLSFPTVDAYLSEVNEPTSGKVRLALQQDAVLRELLSTPLILQIFIKAYQAISLEDILRPTTLEERRQLIFQAYIQELLHHRKPHLYSPDKTLRWLSWLAAQMLQKEGNTRTSEDILFLPQYLDLEWFPDQGLTPSWVIFILLNSLFWLLALCFLNAVAITFACMYTFLSVGPAMIVDNDSFRMTGISDTPWYEVRMSIIAASISGGLAGCVSTFIFGPVLGLTIGTYLGLCTGLVLGGFHYFTYAILSICLWRKGYKPWSYTHFLAYAVDCGLLYRRNNGYQFPHLLLRDYFAERNTLRTSDFNRYEHERIKDSSTLEA